MVVLTLAALTIVVSLVGWDSLWDALGNTTWSWLLAMYLTMAGARTFEARQMAVLLYRSGAYVPWLRVLLANSLSAFYSFLVPGDLVASGAKWSNLAAATGKRSLVLNAIIYNRLALLMPTLAAGFLALVFEDSVANKSVGPVIGGTFIVAVVLMVSLWHPRLGIPLGRLLGWVSRPMPAPVRDRVDMVLSSMQSLRSLRARDHVTVMSFGIVATALSIAGSVVVYQAVGIGLPFITIVWIHALVVAVRQLPITIGGLGVREGLLVVLLAPYGVAAGEAVTIGLLIFTNSVLFGLIGGAYQLALSMGWATWHMVSRDTPGSTNRARG